MKADAIEVSQLFINRLRYCVPLYQRHYVWKRDKQLEPLWDDIRNQSISRLRRLEQRYTHYMGALVLEGIHDSVAQVRRYHVVDGQQRLLTFQMFIKAAFDYAEFKNWTDDATELKPFLLNGNENTMERPDVERYKVWPTEYDRGIFTDIINSNRAEIRRKYSDRFYREKPDIFLENKSKTEPLVFYPYGYFYERIRNFVETDLDDSIEGIDQWKRFSAVYQSFLFDFKVVQITLEIGDDPQIIFETLNDKAEPLLATDLVRNNIFQRASSQRSDAERIFRHHWLQFEDEWWYEKESKAGREKARIEFFLANFLSGVTCVEINQGKLFSEYKSYLTTAGQPRYKNVFDELAELERLGRIYRMLSEPDGNTSLGRFSIRLAPWDVKTVYPLVMQLWRNTEGREDEREVFLNVLISYIVRRSVCNLSTKNLGRIFLQAIVHSNKNGWAPTSFCQFLINQEGDSGIFPPDERFRACWLDEPSYDILKPNRVQQILKEIEIQMRTTRNESVDHGKLTVEHILPQQWKKNWKLPNGTRPSDELLLKAKRTLDETDPEIAPIVRRNRLMHSFGNLTLITGPLNSEVGNAEFKTKKAALQAHSLLVLNNRIGDYKEWDEETILRRGMELFEVAKSIWKYPTV